MIYIYYAYLSAENHENLLKNELSKFSVDFIQKIKKHKRWQDAQLSLLGRILLFRGVREQFDINLEEKDIVYNTANKPFFKDNPVYFSISHSGEIAICAISNSTQIGIDIEKLTPIDIDNFRSYKLDEEWNKINLSMNKYEAFFDYWTLKEAVLKVFGWGQMELKSFEIIDNTTTIKGSTFYLKEIKIDSEYKCTLSYANKIDHKQKEDFAYLYKINL